MIAPTKTILYVIICVALFTGCASGGTSESHFQQGQKLARQSRTAEAMREYRLAIEANDDGPSVTKAISELGHLSMARHDLSEALEYFSQAWQRATDDGDLPQMVLAQRDLGRCQRASGQPDEALRCFARADSLLTAGRADSLRGYVYPEYVSTLMEADRTDDALTLMRHIPVSQSSGPLCLVTGRLFRELGQFDSAAYYLHRCLEFGHVNSSASAAMYLAEMADELGDWNHAYTYAMECATLVDSAKCLMQAENANLISSLNGQIDVERENSRLYRLMALVIVVAIVVIAGLVIGVRERINRLRRQQEAERQAQISRARTRQEHLVEDFHNTPLYRRMIVAEAMNDELWAEVGQFLDEHADHFTNRLAAYYPKIKPQELQACQLLKLEFTNQQVAQLLCRTQQAITNLRKRLFQKMFEREGSADEMDVFLRFFPPE